MNGVQTRLKCKPNVKQCKRLVFPARSALFNHNILNTKAISHFQANHILIRFVFPPLCCILFVFPVIVSMGAGGKVTGKRSTAVCKFLGDISYPVYITHYPLVYTYTAWVCNNNATLAEGIPYMILTFAGAFILAYACLKLYDEPIRKWLTDRFLKGKKAVKS